MSIIDQAFESHRESERDHEAIAARKTILEICIAEVAGTATEADAERLVAAMRASKLGHPDKYCRQLVGRIRNTVEAHRQLRKLQSQLPNPAQRRDEIHAERADAQAILERADNELRELVAMEQRQGEAEAHVRTVRDRYPDCHNADGTPIDEIAQLIAE
ncbi:hypothetical protein [Crateriforma spongiae]|uniref:hypothetical protein n=1 Tax=Crateriforma spongiae TaxID=2724528 RepID=UPI00144809AD|nr:hypothetical protein [Crateriforma spongiae]